MKAVDLLHMEGVNLDPLTETYSIDFYLEYLSKWPEMCHVMMDINREIVAYIIGKLESSPAWNLPSKTPYDPNTNTNDQYLPWHAHITALSVAPHARRHGHAKRLTACLEFEAERADAWFVDLFVRADNQKAIKLYENMGCGAPPTLNITDYDSYSIYRRVVEYYNDGCDGFDMRKAMSRDKASKHIRADGANFRVSQDDVW